MVLPLAARSAAGGGFGYRRRSPDAIAAMIALLVCAASLLALYEAGSAVASGSHGRRLLQAAEGLGAGLSPPSPPLASKPPSPAGAETSLHYTGAQKFGVIFYVLGILYCLLGFAIVCEEYFVASLLVLGAKFKLSDDVNGATLMAAGSSMPEVFSSLVSLFSASTDNSLGMATVVGSSVYNILIIIGWSAVAGKDIMLDWKPLVRDSFFYFVTIFYLIGAFSNGAIGLLQSVIALMLYSGYVYFMTRNGEAFAMMDALAAQYSPYLASKTADRLAIKHSREAQAGALAHAATPRDLELVPITRIDGSPVGSGEAETSGLLSSDGAGGGDHGGGGGGGGSTAEHGDEEHSEEMVWPHSGSPLDKFKFVVKFPIVTIFKYTIPNCKEPKWKEHYWFTFVAAIVWIGILAYYMVEWAQHCSCVMQIPSIIIGLTVLAAGTSLPDTLSSVVVARKGLGDMAVANAIGSNVFNVLFGLGMPWTVFILYSGGKPIVMESAGLLENAFTMLAVGIFYMTVFTSRGFHMTTKLGYIFIGIYGAYCLMIFVRYRNAPISMITCAASTE